MWHSATHWPRWISTKTFSKFMFEAGLVVALWEAVHSRWHKMAIGGRELNGAGQLVLGRQHATLTERLDALIIAIGGIAAGVHHCNQTTGIFEHHCTHIDITHRFDFGVVAVPSGRDRFWYLTTTEEVKHVKVMDQHVMKDSAAGAEVFHGRKGIVSAASFEQLQVPNCSCI